MFVDESAELVLRAIADAEDAGSPVVLETERKAGSLTGPIECDTVQNGLKDAELELVPHLAHDLLVGGARLTLMPPPQDCLSDAKH